MVILGYEPPAIIDRLERLLAHPSPDAFVLADKLRRERAGAAAEAETAEALDAAFGDSGEFVVFHGLRFSSGDMWHQIDHLILTRDFRAIAVESKSMAGGVKVGGDGQFKRFDVRSRNFVDIPSPIEQGRIQLIALDRLIAKQRLVPRRFGIRRTMLCEVFVSIASTVGIVREVPTSFASVVSTSALAETIRDSLEDLSVEDRFFRRVNRLSAGAFTTLACRILDANRPKAWSSDALVGAARAEADPKVRPDCRGRPSLRIAG